MQLERVSISGIDESASQEELKEVHAEFPFVEWSLLIHNGPPRPRYPSAAWRNRLLERSGEMSFVAHLEADLCREVFSGRIHPDLNLSAYKRVQFNFSRELDYFVKLAPISLHHLPKLNYIVQIPRLDDQNIGLAQRIQSQGLDVSILYDGSWGRGILPENWPAPSAEFGTGMAGGLSPDNLEEQLAKISALPGPRPTWIDLETNVRDPISDTIDFERVRTCLIIARDYVIE